MIFTAVLTSASPNSVKITPKTALVSNHPAMSVSRIAAPNTTAICSNNASVFLLLTPLPSISMSTKCLRERSERFRSRLNIRRK